MIYKVTKQFGTGRENPDRSFNKLDEAKAYADQSAETDANMKIQVVYRVYEFDDVMYQVDASKVNLANKATEESSGSSAGVGSGATFKPTPFEMSPRPKGTPQKWIHDEDEGKDKK